MKRPRLRLFVVTLALAGTFSLGYWVSRVRAAGIPAMAALTYSGTLTDLSGAPLTGSKNVLLQLYAMATGGTALCASTPTSVTLVSGTFQVPLGDDCVDVIHANPDLWIDVLIDGASIGRSKLGAVPYAVEADTAQHAASANTAAGTLATTISNVANSVANVANDGRHLDVPDRTTTRRGRTCASRAPQPCIRRPTCTPPPTSAVPCKVGHVCSRNEMFQACAAVGTNGIPATFNPYGAATLGWYSDHGPTDDIYLEWNVASCTDNNDGPPQTSATLLPYRCCK